MVAHANRSNIVIEDDTKFLCIYRPYPLNANIELDEDARHVVFWLACITGKEHIVALHFKPRTERIIIAEISKKFDRWNDLLGEHKWSEFLQNPTEEEKEGVSQIFYCKRSNSDAVRKGFKVKDIPEGWFTKYKWAPNNKRIVHPYPKSSYCSPPLEDPTNAALCCPLPVADFPKPSNTIQPRPAPAGSAQWLAEKNNGSIPLQGAWASKANASKKTPKIPAPAPAWGANRPAILPGPPGIATPSPLQYGSSSSEGKAGVSIVPRLTPDNSSSGSRSSGSNDGDSEPDVSSRAASLTSRTEVAFANAMAIVALEDDEHWEEGDDGPPTMWAVNAAQEVPEADISVNMWDNYTVKPVDETEFYCTTHSKLCRKGICRERSYAENQKKREEEKRKQKEEQENRKKNKKAKSKPENDDDAPTTHKYINNRQGEKWKVPVPPAASAQPAITSPTTSVSNAEGGSAAPRPARGRKMNTSNNSATPSPLITATASSSSPPAQDSVSNAGSGRGWDNVSLGPWGRSDSVKSPAPASEAGSWGVGSAIAPWNQASAKVTKGSKNQSSSGWPAIGSKPAAPAKAPSVASSAGNGWGNVAKGPWGTPSVRSAASSVNGNGVSWDNVPRGSQGAPSVPSTTSGWGHVSNRPWAGGSVKGVDDDARTETDFSVSGDVATKIKKSWADQMDEDDLESVF
ncbi:hypothetical protein ABKN59_006184 [Abortiporus biennis]